MSYTGGLSFDSSFHDGRCCRRNGGWMGICMKEWNSFEEERTGARRKALVLLTDMDRTEKGLLEKLQKSGFSPEAAKDALEYVRSYGYIDDARYAEHYVEVMQKKRSRRRMEYDLVRKGVPQERIDAAMDTQGPEDERPLIRELAEKKAKHMDLGNPKDFNRLAAFLSRRGFRSEDILSVLSSLGPVTK